MRYYKLIMPLPQTLHQALVAGATLFKYCSRISELDVWNSYLKRSIKIAYRKPCQGDWISDD